MKVLISMLTLLIIATALLAIDIPLPAPWLPSPFEILQWHMERYGDCFGRDPYTFTINQRCPEFI